MMGHDARAPQAPLLHLPPLVLSRSAGRTSPACVRQAGVPGGAEEEGQARWRVRNPDYAAAYRLQRRNSQPEPPEPLRLPASLNQLPWDLAKDVIGTQAADFLGVMGGLLVRSAKDEIRRHLSDSTRVFLLLPPPAGKDAFPPAPAARRLTRPAGAPPLATIRSLAYFVPVIDEVSSLQVGPEYFRYLRQKVERHTRPW